MPVDISDILHVLAHELRTPVGIAHGYVRLLLEDRLPDSADRRRAIEQLQKALGRLTDLSHESSALANWYQREEQSSITVSARSVLRGMAATEFEWPVNVNVSEVSDESMIRTSDQAGLERALAALVRSTARELRGRTCECTAFDAGRHLDLLVGSHDDLERLTTGPEGPAAAPVSIDRGGLGLALVHATIVLEDHGGSCWSSDGSRHAVGVRIPLEEKSAQ